MLDKDDLRTLPAAALAAGRVTKPEYDLDMEFRQLGRTGLTVSRLALGGAMFGGWGDGDEADSIRLIHAALDAGINLVDTADAYSAGESERIIGKALSGGKRDGIVLATKFHNPMGDDPNRHGNSRRWIFQAVDESLKRLQTDWIDLYQAHRFDFRSDLEETIAALDDLVRAGKIRYFGSSNFAAHVVVEAQWVSESNNLGRFICEQSPYSILARGIEADLLPVCARHGLGVVIWSPLSGGWLSGKYDADNSPESSRRGWITPRRYDMSLPGNRAKLDALLRLHKLAEASGLGLMDVAIAFVLEHPTVTTVIAGPRSCDQLPAYLSASRIRLDSHILDRIDEIVSPGATFNPGDVVWEPPELVDSRLRRRSKLST